MAPTALSILYPSLLMSLAAQQNQIIFPGEDGSLNLIDLNAPEPREEVLADIRESLSSDIHFFLYTRKNAQRQEMYVNMSNLEDTDWDPRRPTRIVTHGWKATGSSHSCSKIRDAYLEVGDYNVIIMDWRRIASNVFYIAVAGAVPYIADHLTEFIEKLQEVGNLDLSTTKLIGHSLGAHIVGLAAYRANGVVAEIVGLDPAGPGFTKADRDSRIDAIDGKHVQIIHTSAGRLSLEAPIGTSDFYPNGGIVQPGCGTDLFGSCSHSRSYYYFAESIKNPTGFRSISTTQTPHEGEQVFMGGPTLDSKAKGSYVLKTADTPPYALG